MYLNWSSVDKCDVLEFVFTKVYLITNFLPDIKQIEPSWKHERKFDQGEKWVFIKCVRKEGNGVLVELNITSHDRDIPEVQLTTAISARNRIASLHVGLVGNTFIQNSMTDVLKWKFATRLLQQQNNQPLASVYFKHWMIDSTVGVQYTTVYKYTV